MVNFSSHKLELAYLTCCKKPWLKPPSLHHHPHSHKLTSHDDDKQAYKRLNSIMRTIPGMERNGRGPLQIWYDQNRGIVLALSKVLGGHLDVVIMFLHNLTLCNYSRVLNPLTNKWQGYHIPFTNSSNLCSLHMGIFNDIGYLRDPLAPNSLVRLLGVIQLFLKEAPPTNYIFDLARQHLLPPHVFNTSTSKKNSHHHIRKVAAGTRGRRRKSLRQEFDIYGRNGPFNPFGTFSANERFRGFHRLRPGQQLTLQTNCVPSLSSETPAYLRPGENPYEQHWSSQGFNSTAQSTFLGHSGFNTDKRLTIRGAAMADLLLSLNDKYNLTRNKRKLIEAFYNVDMLTKDKNDSVHQSQKSSISRATNNISSTYTDAAELNLNKYDRVRTQIKFISSKRSRDRSRDHVPVEDTSKRWYYGASIPVLMHQPFDYRKSITWLQRHPHQLRLNDRNEIIDANIKRYKRMTVLEKLSELDSDLSVHSTISTGEERTRGKLGRKIHKP